MIHRFYIFPQTGVALWGPGSAVRGKDSVYQAKISARELASVVSRGLQGASRGLPWPPVVCYATIIFFFFTTC